MAAEPRVLADRYELVELLARGGMSEVFLAQDRRLSRPVAVKVLAAELSRDPNFVERFRHEAQAAANLNHPNIVSVYDWGQDGDTSFIVMEYIDGRSVRDLITARGRLDDRQVAGIGGEIAAALGSAHAAGVIHRDVKPANVLISSQGQVKVTDFGIALSGNSPNELTKAGSVMGTATYFSPEQAQGFEVDARSDLYSLGIVLYEMSTGTPPFAGDNAVAVAYQQVQEQVPPPSMRNPAIAPALEGIILSTLAKDPNARYQTADDLRADLLRFRRSEQVLGGPQTAQVVEMPTAAVPGVPTGAGGATATTAAVRQAPRGRNKGVVATVAVLIGILILVVAGLLAARFTNDTSRSEVDVPSVIGIQEQPATLTLQQRGFKVRVDRLPSTRPEGEVFGQDPRPGTRINEGETVLLRVSAGEGSVKIPAVENEVAEDARLDLEAAGFTVTSVDEASETIEEGNAIRTDPPTGRSVPVDTPVTLYVSTGKPKVTVPNVANLTLNDALVQLQGVGLIPQTTRQPSATVPIDSVVSSDPPGGTIVPKGTVVKLVISSGPAPTPIPNVVGLTPAVATSTLEAAGFSVLVQNTASLDAQSGKVVSQSPGAGTAAATGTTVTIQVGTGGITTTTSSTT
ncbi:MAG: Stk1 family PASTA domain-containing Ser/Thr kinase [Actinomycetes bacterium]